MFIEFDNYLGIYYTEMSNANVYQWSKSKHNPMSLINGKALINREGGKNTLLQKNLGEGGFLIARASRDPYNQ